MQLYRPALRNGWQIFLSRHKGQILVSFFSPATDYYVMKAFISEHKAVKWINEMLSTDASVAGDVAPEVP